jgi:hypothetical protein
MFRRERPQLYFSEDGAMTPLYLYTGVQPTSRSGDTYTLVQPLTTAAAWEAANAIEHEDRPRVGGGINIERKSTHNRLNIKSFY